MELGKRLTQRYNDAIAANKTLKDMLTFIEKEGNNLDPFILQGLKDSVIQRFEITYDSIFKYLQTLFYKRGIDVGSPRDAFQQCLSQKITNEQETDILFDMVTDRNLTSHLYNQEMADKVYNRVDKYNKIIQVILKRVAV